MLELAPWLLLGAAVGGLLHVLLPPGLLKGHLRGAWGVVKAVALGVPMPLCSCGVIPVGVSLKRSGASGGSVVGFLISTPQTGVDSILVAASLLGWPFALFKVAAAAVTGVVGGWITDRAAPSGGMPSLEVVDDDAPRAGNRVREFFSYAQMLIRSIWRWLVFGVLVSAAITVLLPADALAGLADYGGLAAMLLTLAVSVPLYVCAVASVPIAAALVAGGFPTGAALVFLMAGPATNVATMGAVRRTLGGRALGVYLVVIIVGSVAAGLLFEAVLPAAGAVDALGEHSMGWWAVASAVALLALFARFAFDEARAALGRGNAPAPGDASLAVGVDGMTCDGCTAKLERTLRDAEGVDAARVTLTPGRAIVSGGVSKERVRELVRKAGFTPRE